MVSARVRTLALCAVLIVAALGACRGRDDHHEPRDDGPDVPIAGQQAARDAEEHAADEAEDAADARAEAEAELEAEPDVIAITNTQGSIVLGLRRDTVYMRLSDSVLARAGEKLDSTHASSGLGGWIEKTVKGTVRDALSRRVAYGLDEIEDVRYANGAIRFDYHDKHTLSFEDLKVDDRPVLEDFSPDEARRFVAAVRAAKRDN